MICRIHAAEALRGWLFGGSCSRFHHSHPGVISSVSDLTIPLAGSEASRQIPGVLLQVAEGIVSDWA